MPNVLRGLLVSSLLFGSVVAHAQEAPSGPWRGLSAPSAPSPQPAPADAPPALPAEPAPPVQSPPPEPPPQVVAPAALPPAPPPPVAQPTTQDDAVRLSPPPPPGTPRRTSDAQVAAARERTQDEERDPMGWFGVSVKVGFANVNSGVLDNPTYSEGLASRAALLPRETLEGYNLIGSGACTPIDKKCRTTSRQGFQLAVTLHIGGDGFGWDIEPYLTAGGNALAVGAYTGPKFDIHATDDLYVGFGFGAKLAYVSLEGWRNGGDVFGRIPVHATYYLTDNFALTAEGSFGAGVSLFVSEPINYTDPGPPERTLATAPKIAFGAARSWDLTFGVRFP